MLQIILSISETQNATLENTDTSVAFGSCADAQFNDKIVELNTEILELVSDYNKFRAKLQTFFNVERVLENILEKYKEYLLLKKIPKEALNDEQKKQMLHLEKLIAESCKNNILFNEIKSFQSSLI